MQLEDHLGDIIRKARASRKITPEEAARAAGVSPVELAALEDSGQAKGPIDFVPLATLIGVSAEKLERIARGWLPSPHEPGKWRHLHVVTTLAEGMNVNCFLVWDPASRDAALFDTGWDAGPIHRLIKGNNLALHHIFITHSHTDHVAALGDLRAKYPEAALHSDAPSAPARHRNRRDDRIAVGALRVTNRETPGHAEDGITYIIDHWPDGAPQVAVVGDAIFAASMGRGNQSWDLARSKVRENILTLPEATLLCPGHGPLTTVGEERANNPFF